MPTSNRKNAVDVKAQFLRLIGIAADNSGKKREAIAIELSEITGLKISLDKVKRYLDGSVNLPAFLVADFCAVCGDDEPLFFLLRLRGKEPAGKDVQDLARLGQMCIEDETRDAERQAIKHRLKTR